MQVHSFATAPLLTRIDAKAGPLQRVELGTLEDYERARGDLVRELIALKRHRRARLGDHCSIVFESRATVWFQIEEELRFHSGDRQARAIELLEQYVDLLPSAGDLRASLFLDGDDTSRARELSVQLAPHIEALTLELPSGRYTAHSLDSLDAGISGVVYVRFVRAGAAREGVPASLRWSMPRYEVDVSLTTEMTQALVSLAGEG